MRRLTLTGMSDSVAKVSGLPAGYRTTFAKIFRIFAMVIGTAVVVQFGLAGYGAFAHRDGGFDAHETLGSVIGGLTLLLLIVAVIARPGRTPLIGAIVLFVLAGPVQPLLASLGKDHGAWWGALHAIVGIAILAMCGLTSRRINVT